MLRGKRDDHVAYLIHWFGSHDGLTSGVHTYNPKVHPPGNYEVVFVRRSKALGGLLLGLVRCDGLGAKITYSAPSYEPLMQTAVARLLERFG